MRTPSKAELATMLVFSFRYALGRTSTAPSAVLDLLRAFGDVLEPWQREQIVRDIESAITFGCAGDACDVDLWRQVQAWASRPERETE